MKVRHGKIKLVIHILLMKMILKNFLRWVIGVQFSKEEKLTKIAAIVREEILKLSDSSL